MYRMSDGNLVNLDLATDIRVSGMISPFRVSIFFGDKDTESLFPEKFETLEEARRFIDSLFHKICQV